MEWELSVDSMGGGAMAPLVAGVISLLDYVVNEGDPRQLDCSVPQLLRRFSLHRGICGALPMEAGGDHRSVRPVIIPDCTRATPIHVTSCFKPGPRDPRNLSNL